MSVSTCVVRDFIYKQDGSPDAGARVTATLSRWEVDLDEGYIGPAEVETVTNDEGYFELELFPQLDGSTESVYVVRIEGAERSLAVKAVVPATGQVWLRDVAALPAFPGKPDGQAAIEAAAEALAAADRAEATVAVFSEDPPENPIAGARWTDANSGRTFEWIVDVDSAQWVEVGASIQIGYDTAIQAASAAAAAAISEASAEVSAASASDSAEAAAVSEASAELAATRAEDARDEAQAAAISSALSLAAYDTIALGRAAVSDGQTFWVKPNATDSLTRYTNFLRVSSSEHTFVASVVSGNEIDAFKVMNNGDLALMVFADADDNVLAYIRDDLALMIATASGYVPLLPSEPLTDIGNGTLAVLSDALEQVFAKWDLDAMLYLVGEERPVQHTMRIVRESNVAQLPAQLLRLNANIARAYLEGERARVADIMSIYHNQIIAAQGADGMLQQRIPGLLVLSPTTALVAWQQKIPSDPPYAGDAKYQRLVCRTITYTPGVGLSSDGTRIVHAPANPKHVANHPHVFRNDAGDLIVLYNTNEVSGVEAQYRVYRRVSTDGGQTWGDDTEVAVPTVGSLSIILGSNGTVEQIPAGYPNAGRWMVPIYGVDFGGPYCGLLVSDDDGETWSVGPVLRNGRPIQEPSITLTHEGDVLMAMRRDDDPYLVHFARMPMDPGTTWEDQGLAPNMPTATCDMSMTRAAVSFGDGYPVVAHCGPSIVARRANRIRLSFDAGRTWQWSWKRPDVPDGPGNGAGYTSIKMLDRDLFIVAYETASSSTTDSDIGVYVVNQSEVMKNGSGI